MSRSRATATTVPSRRPIQTIATSVLGCLALLAPGALLAANSPAKPVPESRWGSPQQLRPWAIIGDSTHYDGSFAPRAETPIWFAADMAGQYLFTATGKGVQVHDTGADPTDPPRLGYTYAPNAAPTWFQSDLKFYLYDIAVPAGNPNVGATVGAGQGILIWDFSTKTNPKVHYQDYQHGRESDSVWAGRLGGRDYAFMAVGGDGINVYDLTRAAAYNGCDSATGNCSDVYRTTLPTGGPAEAVAGAGKFLAVAVSFNGAEIYNVTNPTAPTLVLQGDPGGRYLHLGFWKAGTKYYLALLDSTETDAGNVTRIYDVSCITSGNCSTVQPLSKAPVASFGSNGELANRIKVSQTGGRTFLYVGSTDRFSGGDQREYLWEVTDPGSPEELTPNNPEGEAYWGWYYAGNDTGFTNVAPHSAVLRQAPNGRFFAYRAAWTVLDVHEPLGSAPPVADFDWSPKANAQGDVYQGEQITFSDQSAGGPTAWDWAFVGASPSTASSAQQNPKVTFSGVDTATATLTATNEAGDSDPVSKSFQVLDPTPVVTNVDASPSPALVCQQVTFTAEATGRPTLSYSWKVTDGTNTVAEGSGNPFTWDTSVTTASWSPSAATDGESYTAEVTATNTAGSATGDTTVTLDLPDPPAVDSGPSANVSFGTVQLSAQTTGAASWTWDYGDGSSETFFTEAEGESPTHSYTQADVDAECGGTLPCTFTVTLTVDNCLFPAASASVQVTIEEIAPLEIRSFAAVNQCQLGGQTGGCFRVDKAVEFFHDVGGDPDTYEYDWDGDGTWDETSSAPVTSHTYSQAGTYLPKLRVTRGTEPKVVAENGQGTCSNCTEGEITVEPATPASIDVFGPSSGSVGDALAFSASADGCSAASGTWSWSASGGGSVIGSGSSVNITWTTTGSKTVSVTNSACGSATGSKTVSIGSGSNDGGGDTGGSDDKPVARIELTPSSPTVGEPVTLDASSSTGNITSYSWKIGQDSFGSGKTVVHTFSEPGSVVVELTVSGPGDCKSQVGGLQGICTDTEAKTVSVRAGNAVAASFEDDADCDTGQVGGGFCSVGTGREVTFTDTSTGEVSERTWDFGDGTTRKGAAVTHAWTEPGTYKVVLTVANDDSSSTASKTYTVTGDPVSKVLAVVVPWIAQAGQDTALPQASDLDVHNTGDDELQVRITFRKRGLPEKEPPQKTVKIEPNATRHFPNVLEELLEVDRNLSGFLFIEVLQGSGKPVVSSVNRTFARDGRIFGQVVPGFSVASLPAPVVEEGGQTFHLAGLNDTPDRLSYFGITNPAEAPLFYHLRFYDKFGKLTGQTEEPEGIARLGQRQFQVEELRERFGVQDLDDFRVEILPEEGSPRPFVYAANLRLFSRDPSFLRVGRTDQDDVFLLGTLNTPGLNDSLFQSDVVLANVDDGAAECALTFTSTGVRAEPTEAIVKDLPPRESLRLENIVAEWDVGNSVGVLRVRCDGENGVAPVVQGESYDVSRPPEFYGQFMPALTAEQTARPGLPHSLVGLRQDDESRTTVWLYNPSADEVALYAVRYFDSAGNEVGGESDLRLGPGKFRQINPGHHPEEVQGDFVVRIEVSEGSILSAAQVVNEANDPAYVVGQ